MEKLIGVVDYGLGNLHSVSKALEFLGAKVLVSSKVEELSSSKALILPGVGAFKRGMKNLECLGLKDFIIESIQKGLPFLGICLGFQLLFTESEEQGRIQGLDLIKGRVVKFPSSVKIPHMGWNQVNIKAQSSKLKAQSLFKGIPDGSFFYFVHSYYARPQDKEVIVATTEYAEEFASVINKENIWGVQFHPEKSGDLGLRLLKNFLSYVG